MIKPGMFISDRYEIIDKVGSGGMADVYKAKCHRLNRYVAIKILKSEFSSDRNFVTKFRGEAQSVAGLSHPNIVSVYDVGDDDGLHYIVMELVEGITLKRFIERKGRLDIKEAVGISIQIAQGMEAAHDNHIIHRDIKPQNIIISRDGKVKVADFGIAKAATSNTVSQNAIGSVHYLSPEQARGGYSDERSDIYSLGVTLYEMLCGQVPFAGDNSVSVALLHIQSEATPIQQLNPDVPASVDKIVQKCMQKKPERRYQSASELIRDLKRSILNPDGDYVSIAEGNTVSDSPTIHMTDDEMSSIKSAAKTPAVHFDNSNPQRVNRKVRKEEEEEDLDSMDTRLEKVLTVVSIVAAAALVIFILYMLYNFFLADPDEEPTPGPTITITAPPSTQSPIMTQSPSLSPTPIDVEVVDETVTMPLVVGLMLDDALELLEKTSTDFVVDWSKEEYSEEYEKGYVSVQYPPKDIMLDRDSKITLTISAGNEFVELTDVVNREYTSAVELLTALKYVPVVIREPNVDVTPDYVIRTEPAAGDMVKEGQEIILYVSELPEIVQVAVPKLIGFDKAGAEALLTEAGLQPGEPTYVYSDDYAEGLVCNQSIAEGQLVETGMVVDYSVSMGSYDDEPADIPAEGDTGEDETPAEGDEPPVEDEPEITDEPEPTTAPDDGGSDEPVG